MATIQLKSIPYKNYEPGHCYEVSEEEASAAVSDGAAIRLSDGIGVRLSPAPAPWPAVDVAVEEAPPADEVETDAPVEDVPFELTEEVKSEE